MIRAALWDGQSPTRFETEVRALARLSHANIARVLESGTFPEPGGVRRPYLVMELVDGGRPINQSVAGLERTARLSLVEDLCRAVAHAHQHGVLHRDLKPGNVLVGADGQVKVIDFGIARLEEDTDHATLTGQLLGTPAYMSPEQLRGGIADTRTDVHAIGLIGREIMGPELLTGDVQIVFDTACAADPQDRYQSVADLAQDLARIREHRVILAKNATALEVAFKYAKRNRPLCIGVGAVAFTVIAAVVLLMVFAGQTARANADARDVASFMLDRMVDRLEDRIGSAADRRELATKLLVHVDRLALRSSDETVEEPRARLHRILGDEAQAAGENQTAMDHLGQALTIRQHLAAARPEHAELQAELSVAIVRVGDVLGAAGHLDEQSIHYERAMQIDRSLAVEHPEDQHFASNLIYSLMRVADLWVKSNEPTRAMPLASEQLEIATRFLSRHPQDASWLWEVVQAQSWLDDVVRAAGVQPRAAPSLNDRLDVARRLAAADPDSRRSAVRLMSVLLQLMSELASAGRVAEAVAVAEGNVQVSRRLIAADPSDLTGIAWLTRSLAAKASVHSKMGDEAMVVSCIEQAKAACTQFELVRGSDWETVDLWSCVFRHEADSFTSLGKADCANVANREGIALLGTFRNQTGGKVHWREIALRCRCAYACLTDPSPVERADLHAMTSILADGQVRWRQADLADQLLSAGRFAEAMDIIAHIKGLGADPSDSISEQVDRIERACVAQLKASAPP